MSTHSPRPMNAIIDSNNDPHARIADPRSFRVASRSGRSNGTFARRARVTLALAPAFPERAHGIVMMMTHTSRAMAVTPATRVAKARGRGIAARGLARPARAEVAVTAEKGVENALRRGQVRARA